MSIREEISDEIQRGRLFDLRPLAGGVRRREVYVSQQVYEMISQPWPDDERALRFSAARAVLDDFSIGRRIVVADDPYRKRKNTTLARIAPTRDEIWDFRCRAPKEGIRIFGRFALVDVFVALTWKFREELSSDPVLWRAEVQDAKAQWRLLFKTYPPHTGESVNDYLTGGFDLG